MDDDLFVVSADGCFLLEKLPLMLSPKSHRSPNFYKKNDSLIFSVTSEKNRSDKDEMLIDSKEEEVSRELTKLQIKLSCL